MNRLIDRLLKLHLFYFLRWNHKLPEQPTVSSVTNTLGF